MDKEINFTLNPARALTVSTNPKTQFHCGSKVLEVTFPNPVLVEISEINFKNYYANNLTIKAKKKDIASSKWLTCVKRLQLMPYSHCDTGAEDYFTIASKQMLVPLVNIEALVIILRQPSPIWRDFKIEDLQLLKFPLQTAKSKGPAALPPWLTDGPPPTDRQLKGVPSLTGLSQSMQQLWAFNAQLQEKQTSTSVGRYDIDGKYDITLLSYT